MLDLDHEHVVLTNWHNPSFPTASVSPSSINALAWSHQCKTREI